MSKPAIIPDTTVSGIAVDPRTLERVVPESRRPDGSIRKERKIRPGFTPQEDVRRFRGTRQQQMDATALPKGHILGWAPPPAAPVLPASKASMSKAQKKNEKRKEKRKEKRDEETKVKDSWEDEDEEDREQAGAKDARKADGEGEGPRAKEGEARAKPDDADALTHELKKLEVR
ncbi:hypothetical protein OBBRIDRAFT_790133 [Obba rivulosa]|uniref:WIBG Mago-binding domain-containing protein n=1 Tax=Obba rivulosa TaxID=1052685 RepID=A0A8E2DPX1_9APHY|nr:hypothetical protein OBBRIDRAFT_790133 [Obba rivulosa]